MTAYLSEYPILLNELINAQFLDTALDWQVLAATLPDDLKVCGGDTEAQMDILRRFQHTQVFRLAAQDLAGLQTVKSLFDQLSTLTDIILTATLPYAWVDMPKRHRDTPQFAVVDYDRLGNRELGCAFDLDLVYLCDDPHPDVGDVYSRLVRRLINWFSTATSAGSLYETGLCLCPNGDAGFLVHSIVTFEKYQHENAWAWERQSLTRTRFTCGIPEVQTAFNRICIEILTTECDRTTLAGETIGIRGKMFPTHPPINSNVKYARGGTTNVEFTVQYLVLTRACRYPQLPDSYGNITLSNIVADCDLIDETLAEQSRIAYRFYRQQ